MVVSSLQTVVRPKLNRKASERSSGGGGSLSFIESVPEPRIVNNLRGCTQGWE